MPSQLALFAPLAVGMLKSQRPRKGFLPSCAKTVAQASAATTAAAKTENFFEIFMRLFLACFNNGGMISQRDRLEIGLARGYFNCFFRAASRLSASSGV